MTALASSPAQDMRHEAARSPKIEIRDLSIDYMTSDGRSGHRALDGLTLDVFENEFLCVVGASGCGKSTLIAAIADSCVRALAPCCSTVRPFADPVPTVGSCSRNMPCSSGGRFWTTSLSGCACAAFLGPSGTASARDFCR